MLDANLLEKNRQQIEAIRQRFLKMVKKIENLQPVFEKFKPEYSAIVAQNFESRGKIMERQRWREFTPGYLNWKRVNYPGKQMLEITGNLKQKAINFETKISKDKMVMMIKGEDYLYYVSDRETYGRKFFYNLDNTLPIQAWRVLIQLVREQLELEQGEGKETL